MSQHLVFRGTFGLVLAAVAAGTGLLALGPKEQAAQAAGPRGPVVRTVADEKTGAVKGVITVNGSVPALEALVKKGDPKAKDTEVCAADTIPNESVLVGKSGGLANVFVYLPKAPEGHKAKPPTTPVVFDQKGCRFKPHCLMVQTGQTVLVKSDDSIAHNTHTNPFRATAFNQVIRPGDRTGVPLVYDKPEKGPTLVKCDLHPWMVAYMLALDHPFMALTDENGAFEISGLPPGSYDFAIWQEKVGYLQKKFPVKIEAGKTAEVKLAVPAKDLSGS